jgi:Tfp pilus assembly protein PilV
MRFRTTTQRGFTLTEIMIAFGMFSLFLIGLFSLYRSAQTASSTAFWLQNIATGLRNATRHISSKVQKSSYPSTLVYPSNIIENSRPDFRLHYSSRGRLTPSICRTTTQKTDVGTQFLRFTESYPEKQGFQETTPASLTYHIYSLTKAGLMMYHRFEETITSTPPDYMNGSGISRPTVPPPFATLVESVELVSDVEAIQIGLQDNAATATPLLVEISCLNPRGQTRRSESSAVVPNVGVVAHPVETDW